MFVAIEDVLRGCLDFLGRGWDHLKEVVDRDLVALSAPPERVDDLVTHDSMHPWCKIGIGLPCVALGMHGEQNLLKDILGLDGRQACPPTGRPDDRTQGRCKTGEEGAISPLVSRQGSPQQLGQLVQVVSQWPSWVFETQALFVTAHLNYFRSLMFFSKNQLTTP
jgi:hypothetical protein